MPLGNRILAAFLEIWRREQLALANLTGNAFLLFVLYAWASNYGESVGDWVQPTLVATAVALAGLWLLAATLASFHQDAKEIPFGPALRRLPRFLPWGLALVVLVVWVGWLASVMTIYVAVLGVAGALILLPMLSQAAGAGFSRDTAVRVISDPHYWLASTALLVAGIYVPFLLLSWVPSSEDFIFRAMFSGIRFGFSHVLAIISWLTLASFIGRLGRELEQESSAPEAAQPNQGRAAAAGERAPTR